MRRLLFLLLLLPFVVSAQNLITPQEASSLVVTEFKWNKSRQLIEKLDTAPAAPVREVITANKNFQRNVRVNDQMGARDPNSDTIDGRSAVMEKNVQDARTVHSKPVDGFEYHAKVQNTASKVIEIVFWEYQFLETANPANVARRQFLCAVNIKAGKSKELQAFSTLGTNDVISVESLSNKTGNLFQEKAVINRVEYSDGTIWQRKDWKFGEIRLGYARAVGTSWGAEMCRGL